MSEVNWSSEIEFEWNGVKFLADLPTGKDLFAKAEDGKTVRLACGCIKEISGKIVVNGKDLTVSMLRELDAPFTLLTNIANAFYNALTKEIGGITEKN